MNLLDQHWPDFIFPTLEDDSKRDAGARIVSLLRWVDQLRSARPLVSGTANRDDMARVRAQADRLLNGGRFEDEWSEAATLIRELLALLGGDQDDEDGAR